MEINIGKGLTLDVDTAKFNGAVMDHIVYIGLRNILMDAHASVTREVAGDDVEAQSRAASEKKLAALYAGEVRVAGTREGDPVKAEAIRLATEAIKAALRKAGRKLPEAKALRAAAGELVVSRPEYTAKAQERIAEQRALSVDVGDLGL